MAEQRKTESADHNSSVDERERCARHCEVLAHFMETGAGPLNEPATRLRQAAHNIRSGQPATLWLPDFSKDQNYRLPSPKCGHGAQPWVIACGECGALPGREATPDGGISPEFVVNVICAAGAEYVEDSNREDVGALLHHLRRSIIEECATALEAEGRRWPSSYVCSMAQAGDFVRQRFASARKERT